MPAKFANEHMALHGPARTSLLDLLPLVTKGSWMFMIC
jgi:hypothetical protein